ncbi:MAG TPA: hypothetical protein VLL52_09115 [Anaerolineae bacterium]|nr:hypothetical protein [Anaerolineae bacterium]
MRKVICLLFVGLLLIWFSWPQGASAGRDLSPAEAVKQAWQRVQDSGRYQFDTEMNQKTYPVPSLTNAGQQPTTERLVIEGDMNRLAQKVDLTLWQNGRGDDANGYDIRYEEGVAYHRVGLEEWEPMRDMPHLLSPNGDPLAFLGTATDFAYVGTELLGVGEQTFSYDRYTFAVDRDAYTELIRAEIDKQLQQYGTLPPGIDRQLPAMYRFMQGEGEVWLNEVGLPSRLVMDLRFPAQNRMGRIEATIETNFSGFDRGRIEEMGVPFVMDPGQWLGLRRAEVVAVGGEAINITGFILVALGLVWMAVVYRRTRYFYMSVIGLVIASMLLTPMIQAVQAVNFNSQLALAQEEQEAEQEKTKALEEARSAVMADDWQWHQDPLASNKLSATMFRQESLLGARTEAERREIESILTITDTTDTDGDGLLDVDEAYWGTCEEQGGASAACQGVADATDTDGDGLSDGLEVNQIGTIPIYADSDSDGIEDAVEISGFTYDMVTYWYLNPMKADTNNDGILDGTECPTWNTTFPDLYDLNVPCVDTDNDGEPDVYDRDNDGDGVNDDADSAIRKV